MSDLLTDKDKKYLETLSHQPDFDVVLPQIEKIIIEAMHDGRAGRTTTDNIYKFFHYFLRSKGIDFLEGLIDNRKEFPLITEEIIGTWNELNSNAPKWSD